MYSTIAINFRNKHILQPDVIACKIDIKFYKALADKNYPLYEQKNLRRVYKTVCKVIPLYNVNFYMSDGFIYLFQERQEGLSCDLSVLEIVKNSFETQEE